MVRVARLFRRGGGRLSAHERSRLRHLVVDLLTRQPGLSAREISRLLTTSTGTPVDKGSVNSCLHGDALQFRSVGEFPPVWFNRDESSKGSRGGQVDRPGGEARPSEWASSLQLYPWQIRALDGWAAHDHRGVVEAVTGAGKTRLALAAIEAQLRGKGRAVAIVPTNDLQDQWLQEIQSHLIHGPCPQATVGRLGGGSTDSLRGADVLVATVQSACQYDLGLGGGHGLLVADEVHHYGAEVWAKALEPGFDRRLGLTATYQRDDDGVETVLDPYFGTYRYSLNYTEALQDDVIAHFKVAFVGVRFSGDEEDLYLEAEEKARRKRSTLINVFGLTPEPFGVFMREVQRLAKSDSEGARQAGLYLGAFSKRRQILAAAASKFTCLSAIAPAVTAAESTIIFTQTREAAERAIEAIERAGVRGATLHAQLEASARREIFDDFRDGTSRVIAAPKLLDEGVDVPDADLALVLASSRSRRQMIQRMGRVIRKKRDGRLGRIAILYVDGTSEDPSAGAHEDFTQFVTAAAEEVRLFSSGEDRRRVVEYLNRW